MDPPRSRECNTCRKTFTKEHYSKRQWGKALRRPISFRGPSTCKSCVSSKATAADTLNAPEKHPKKNGKRRGGAGGADDQPRRAGKRQRIGSCDRETKAVEEEKQHFAFQWSTCPIPKKDEEEMASVLVRKGEFGKLDDDRRDEIIGIAEENQMSFDQALSLRSALLQQKAMETHHQLELKSKKMLSLYKKGAGVVDLSKRFDLPPMQVFRTVLAKMKWKKGRITKCLRDPSRFEKRERREFEAAEAADIVTNVDQSGALERAEIFEECLASWFEDHGVRLRRQAEMIKEQKRDHGRVVRTPDVLFLDHVEINGQAVAWMDAKNFYGSGSMSFQQKRTKRQISKYVEAWGNGAIVYRHGFSKDLCIPSCESLDATALDLSRLEAVEDKLL